MLRSRYINDRLARIVHPNSYTHNGADRGWGMCGMTRSTVIALNRSMQATMEWLNEIKAELG